jgi:hypothetical protein
MIAAIRNVAFWRAKCQSGRNKGSLHQQADDAALAVNTLIAPSRSEAVLGSGFCGASSLPARGTTKAFCVALFVPGKQVEQVAVRQGAEGLRARSVRAQAVAGKDAGFLQAFESIQGDAIAPVQLMENVKHFRFELGVRSKALRLRQRIGAYSFMNSHVSST